MKNVKEKTKEEPTAVEKEKADLLAYLDKWDTEAEAAHKQEPYTEESFKELNNASVKARKVAKKSDVTSEELTTAQKAYDEAWYNLETISSSQSYKSEFLAYLDEWDTKTAANHGTDPYTADSYNAFTKASKTARATANNPDATPEDIEQAKKAYDDAWYALETISSTANTVTPSFKKSMDEYEAFFDQYIAFMQTVASGNFSTSDYLGFMSRYSKAMEAVNSVNENTLSPADKVYYLETMARINTKLTNAALAM